MSAASLSGAPPGIFALSAPIEAEFLNRAGRVWHGLVAYWTQCPDDDHPSIPQIAAQCIELGLGACERTIQRGLADLAKLGKIAIEADLDHPIGRKIRPLVDLPRGVTDLSPGDSSVDDSSVTPYVLRKSASAPYVSRNSGADGVTDLSPPPGESLLHTLGRLEGNPLAVEAVVSALAREFGDGFVPLYRDTCKRVLDGRLAINDLIAAAEYALGPDIKSRGKAFSWSIKERRAGRLGSKASPKPQPPIAMPTTPPRPVEAPKETSTTLPQPTNASPRVEVLPTDEEIRTLRDLAHAPDRFMRAWARGELKRLGRSDLIEGVPWEKEPAGKPPKGLPAGSQPPRR